MSKKAPVLKSWPVETPEDRVGLIYEMSRKSIADPAMQKLARRIVNGRQPGFRGSPVRARDEKGEVGAVFDFIKSNLPYRGDTRYFDTYMACYHALDFAGNGAAAGGDCDDHTGCLTALLWILGYATGAKIIGDENQYTHIYAIVGLPRVRPTRWVPLDTTVPRSKAGWEPPKSARKRERKFLFARDGVYELP